MDGVALYEKELREFTPERERKAREWMESFFKDGEGSPRRRGDDHASSP